MTRFPGSGPPYLSSGLLPTLTLLLFTGCAGNPPPEEATPSDTDTETVDIGYGSVQEDHVVGSVATVEGKDQAFINASTLADMLAKVPGVRVMEGPGGQISVRIRGNNSFLGGQEPLYVIDGMVVQSGGGLSGINPFTIESITVLKDAGSTAIYGSRGANGVILIKTKKK